MSYQLMSSDNHQTNSLLNTKISLAKLQTTLTTSGQESITRISSSGSDLGTAKSSNSTLPSSSSSSTSSTSSLSSFSFASQPQPQQQQQQQQQQQSHSNNGNTTTTSAATTTTTKTASKSDNKKQMKSSNDTPLKRNGTTHNSNGTSDPLHPVTVNDSERPAYSYIALISMAILSKPDRKILLNEIYDWVTSNFNYYQNRTDKSWRNSIRHNLSLNECFIKIGKAGNGRGFYWSIHSANMVDFKKGKIEFFSSFF
jgi:hypothetical protein